MRLKTGTEIRQFSEAISISREFLKASYLPSLSQPPWVHAFPGLNNEIAAKHIKDNLDKQYGAMWHCVIGEGLIFFCLCSSPWTTASRDLDEKIRLQLRRHGAGEQLHVFIKLRLKS